MSVALLVKVAAHAGISSVGGFLGLILEAMVNMPLTLQRMCLM